MRNIRRLKKIIRDSVLVLLQSPDVNLSDLNKRYYIIILANKGTVGNIYDYPIRISTCITLLKPKNIRLP